jgi:REP element-mobilizing transposase RayT
MMPRGPRLDVADALYHVIARGVERRAIVRDDCDRADFVERLAALCVEEGATLFAFVLMDNHFHLVVRRHRRPLGLLLQRLLTGYSGRFNRRHRRAGHLFQNRYKSIVCEEDHYLLELVRYVHLNPVRAGMVTDPASYPWSSHALYLQRRPPGWLHAEPVLALLGGRVAYRRFVAAGMGQGHRPDLAGSDRQRSEASTRRLWLAGQVLGTEGFAHRLLRCARDNRLDRELQHEASALLPSLAKRIARQFGVPEPLLRSASRRRPLPRARRALIFTAVLEHAARPVDIARYLNVSTAAVSHQLRSLESDDAVS